MKIEGVNEIIILRDGDALMGVVQDEEFIVETSYAELRFSKNKIVHIHFKNPPHFPKDEMLLVTSDQISGVIKPENISVKLESSGQIISINQEKIHTIMFTNSMVDEVFP